MENTLTEEIEDQLEVFARNANPLFDISEMIDVINDQGPDAKSKFVLEMDIKEFIALKVCVDFTVGSLAGYLQEIEGVEE